MPQHESPKLAFAYDSRGKRKFSGWRSVYTLLEDYIYVDPKGFIAPITVKKGFESDLASLLLWPFVVGAVLVSIIANILATKYLNDFGEMWVDAGVVAFVALLVGYLRHDGPWAPAAIIHDAIYRLRLAERDMADLVMRKIMAEHKVPFVVAWTFWATLRLCGYPAWLKRSLIAASIWMLASVACAETVLVTVSAKNCPHCRTAERNLAAVRGTLKVQAVTIDEAPLAQSQIDGKRGIPVMVGERQLTVEPFPIRGWPILLACEVEGEQLKIVRRNDGPLTPDELRVFVRGEK